MPCSHDARARLQYAHQRAHVAKKLGGDPNEIDSLKHGTNRTDPVVIVDSDAGLDKRYGSSGYYGAGTYLAEEADYTHNGYKFDAGDGTYKMFLCRAILGRVQQEARADSRTRAFLHPDVGFDSVRGPVRDSQQAYITYELYR